MTRPETYAEYRESNGALGRVPSHWLEPHLSHVAVAPITNGLGEAAADGDADWPRYIRTTDIAGLFELDPGKRVTLAPGVAAGAMLRRNDLLMTAAGSLGTSYLFGGDESACYAGYLVRFRADEAKVLPRFAAWWTRSRHHLDQVALGAVRSTIDNFSAGKFRSMLILLPPLAEQRAIADYLDRETAQIDVLIGKQNRLIETLRERRAAVVEAAFLSTPGLSVTRVRNLLAQRPSYGVLVPTYEDDGAPFVRVGDLGRLTPEMSLPKIPETQSAEFSRTRLRGGEVLLGVVGNMGKSVVAPEWLAGANVARAVAVLRCRADVDAALLNRWFETRRFRDQATLATGSDTAQPTLGMKDLAGFSLLWPTHGEDASRLAADLDEQTAKIDALIAKAERFIEVSKERRSALITAAVTGQIDVREHVGSSGAQVSA